MMIKFCMFMGFFGHAMCAIADCMMSYSKSGRFDISMVNEPEKMRKVFSTMSLKRLEMAMILETIAMVMASHGYIGLAEYVEIYSPVASKVLLFSAMFFLIIITAHYAFCGAIKWYYVRLGRTDEALQIVKEFFKRTDDELQVVVETTKKTVSASLGYVGLFIFAVVLFVLVIKGVTDLPRWACLFNTLVALLALLPVKLPAKTNMASAFMFLGLMMVI